MEFWVVAAATGAGYVAKHWQNLTGEKDGEPKQTPMQSPRVQRDVRQLFDKMPNSVFPMPKLRRCLLDGHVSSPEEEHNKVGMNLQDNTDELRTKNSNGKSFSSLRPLVVARNSKDYQRKQMAQVEDAKDEKIVFMEENRAPMEEEFFEPIGSVKLPRRRPEEMNAKRFETKDLHSQGNDMVSLFLGVTIGLLSTIVTNQREIEHLNELLEQAENMVTDLHNKLELKDGFNTRNEHDTESNMPATYSPKGKKFELTSDIEAELEAELERLEENMQKLSSVVEIDSDFEADMARGDLNLDTLTWQLDSQSESDHDDKWVKSESTGKPFFTPNYTVSSLDLRLRLHEVIESELRARIEELEAVLAGQNGQTYLDSREPKEENSFWDFDHTRIESSSSTPSYA
ncbi:hypothetical protein L1987_79335 [Smallanthus sonchifolius]|uniref:Uncharacterized protein n=1 Tax=Smallanthus sonchifolius TaxID=185202 RepID=A0ACB8ZFF0_9ASTR|nr:hypothetical protein L1987_79335 [Smallanthus sonchifolius]